MEEEGVFGRPEDFGLCPRSSIQVGQLAAINLKVMSHVLSHLIIGYSSKSVVARVDDFADTMRLGEKLLSRDGCTLIQQVHLSA
jgi:hypothetical protein